MAIAILICGWLFKAACIQQGPNGDGGVTLDQGGQRPWITACYNDAVPLFGSHKLNTGDLPYSASWEDNGETRYMEYPVVTGYWMWAMAQLSRAYLSFASTTGLVPVPLDVAAYFTIGAIFLGLMLPGGGLGDGQDRPAADLGHRDHVPVPPVDRARVHQLGPVGDRHHRRRHAGLGPWEAGAGRCPARARDRRQALPDSVARTVADPLPARRQDDRLDQGVPGGRGGVAGDQRSGDARLPAGLVRVHPAELRATARIRLLVLHLCHPDELLGLGRRARVRTLRRW